MKRTLLLPFLWTCLSFVFFLSGQAQVTLPFLEDFEGGGPDTTFVSSTPALNGLSGTGYVWSYQKTNQGRLRMRAWQDWGLANPFTTSGNNAITLDDTLPADTSINDLILTINMSAYTGNQSIEMDFNFANHDEEPHPNDRLFVRGSVFDPWVVLYDLSANQPFPGTWKYVKNVDVDSVLALFSQSFSATTQFRFGQEDDFSAADPTFSDGYTFDDVRIFERADFSAAGIALASPGSACGLGMDTVCITYANVGSLSFDSAMLFYRINGGTIVSALDTSSLNPGDQTTYCFSTLGNFSTVGTSYTVQFWVEAPGDTLRADDTVTTVVTHIQAINTFPYLENFDSGPNGWTAGGSNSSWALATPTGTVINSAASGTHAWVTNPAGFYNPNENSFVQSPCFDFTGMLNPRICLSAWWNSEFSWDGAALQSSTDGGTTWQSVGVFNGVIGDPINWYTDPAIDGNPGGQQAGWTGRTSTGDGSNGYVFAQHDLLGLGGQSQVFLRVVFGSDGFIEDDGFAFDDVLIFDKNLSDASAVSVLSPQSACGLGMETITFAYNNTGVGSFDSARLAFQVNGGTITSEIDTSTLLPGDTAVYAFSGLADFSTPGRNSLKVWVSAPNDVLPFKDTLFVEINNIELISSYPYLENFESGAGDWTTEGNGSWELGLPQGAVIDTAASGRKAWMTDTVNNYFNGECSFVVSPCFDFSTLVSPLVRAKIWVHSELDWDGTSLQVTVDSGRTWNTIGLSGAPNNWYNQANISGLQTCVNDGNGWAGSTMSGYVSAEHPVSFLAGEPSVRFRFAFGSDGSFNAFDGFAFDDFEVFEQASLDGFVLAVEAPLSGCSLGMDTVCISYVNNGLVAFDSTFVSYNINGLTAVTELDTTTLQPGDTAIYCFSQTANFTAIGSYLVEGWINISGDNTPANDTLFTRITHIPEVSAFPYDQDFENGPQGWTSGGQSSSWQLGRPVGATINTAASGTHAWVTDTSGTYNNNESSFVISPCFDFSGLILPILDVAIWWESERGFDGTVLQSTIDNGQSWVNVGDFGDPNWYNDSTIFGTPGGQGRGWTNFVGSVGSGSWVQGTQVLQSLAGEPAVRFRFAFGSDNSVNGFDGFAFDDFSIRESPTYDIQVVSPLTPTSGCGLGLEQIGFRYTNGGITPFDSANISYSVNGAPFVDEIDPRTINVGDTVIFPFSAFYNFSTAGAYTITIVCKLQGDTLAGNDTLRFVVNSVPNISSFPYLEDFEAGPGGWSAAGSTWQWGLPRGATIDTAASGVKAWMTDTLNNYNNNTCAALLSPCFDFSSLAFPVVRANIWVNSEDTWDGTVLQATTDSGLTWITIGAIGTGSNWYNNTNITGLLICLSSGEGWTGEVATGYVQAEQEIAFLAGEPDVRFRFVFGSDPSVNTFDGFAFDDFEIRELPANDVGVTQILEPFTGQCGDSSMAVTVVVKNNGSSDQLSFPIVVQADTGNASYATLTFTYNDTLRPGQLDTVFIGTVNTFAGGIFDFTAFSQLANDADRSNDSVLLSQILIRPIPAPPVAQDTTICEPGLVALSVQVDTNRVYSWYDAASGGNVLAAADTLRAMVTRDTTFYVEAQQRDPGPCLRLTEIDMGLLDAVEIQNLSSQPIDASGYFVAVSNSYTDISDANPIVWTLGTMTAGQVMFRDDDFASGQYWGNNLFFGQGAFPGFAGWAMIADTSGNVLDAVFWGWPASEILNMNLSINGVTITGADIPWIGDGVDVSGLPGSHIELFGAIEENDFTDWDISRQNNSIGFQNGNLILPYRCSSPDCPSLRTEVKVLVRPLIVDLGPDRAACEGTILDGTTTGGVSYLWNTSDTLPRISVNQSGLYVLEVTNQVGCVGSDSINLLLQPAPVVDLGPADTAVCGSIILDAGNPGSQYIWSNGGLGQTEFISLSGTYTVNVTNPSGCSATDTITVDILPVPNVNLGPDVTACEEASLNAGAFPAGFSFLWSTNEITAAINVNTTGLYSVTVTDTIGCEGTDDIVVSILPAPVVDLGMDRTVCDSLVLDAGPFNSFTWNTMQTSRRVIARTSGTYFVEVLDNNGCAGEDTVDIIVEESPVAAWSSFFTSATDVTFTNNSTPNGPGVTYLWDFGDGNMSTLENPTHSYTLAGNYIVSLTVSTPNCGDDEAESRIGTDLEDELFARSITLFPNPSKGIFVLGISGLEADELQIVVSDMTGKTLLEIHESQRIYGNFEQLIDLTGHAEGVYLVTVFDGKRYARKKMVVR